MTASLPTHHHTLRWVAAMALVAVLCGAASATDADMALLPVTEPFLCAICHTSADPNPAVFELNSFGAAFLAEGRQWTVDLAAADADGDNCANGVELGDTDADGFADGNVTTLQSNPGNGTDCGVNTVDPTTWTELKGLFNGRK
ncbi:MAG: hypothetical protein R3D98_08295 [Candidatus Krumholzibacteriia bacterium]